MDLDESKDAEHHEAEHIPSPSKYAQPPLSHTEDSLIDLDEPKHAKHRKTEPTDLSEESPLVDTETPDLTTDNSLSEKDNNEVMRNTEGHGPKEEDKETSDLNLENENNENSNTPDKGNEPELSEKNRDDPLDEDKVPPPNPPEEPELNKKKVIIL